MISELTSTALMIESNALEIRHRFQNPLELNSYLNYELSLMYFSMYNSIFNIRDANNKIHITISGTKDR